MCLAIPGKLVAVSDNEHDIFREGKVSFGGVIKKVNLSMIDDAEVGDYVLVHVGLAISKVDEIEAKKTLELLEQMGELDEIDSSQIDSG